MPTASIGRTPSLSRTARSLRSIAVDAFDPAVLRRGLPVERRWRDRSRRRWRGPSSGGSRPPARLRVRALRPSDGGSSGTPRVHAAGPQAAPPPGWRRSRLRPSGASISASCRWTGAASEAVPVAGAALAFGRRGGRVAGRTAVRAGMALSSMGLVWVIGHEVFHSVVAGSGSTPRPGGNEIRRTGGRRARRAGPTRSSRCRSPADTTCGLAQGHRRDRRPGRAARTARARGTPRASRCSGSPAR